jgi:hypothetical protein
MAQPETVIFWGAGATAPLGLQMSHGQAKFIKHITGARTNEESLDERVTKALDSNNSEPWHSALFDLITILGDTDDNYRGIEFTNDEQLEAMRRNWQEGADGEELRRRIIHLRLIYDWPALKSLVNICPGISGDNLKINDLFNLLDMHIPLGFGVRAPTRQDFSDVKNAEEQFFDARRLIGAKNALRLILLTSFYIDYQECLRSKRDIFEQYCEFSRLLGERMQRKGVELAHHFPLDQPEFYQGDVGFVSLNYDPIALWAQFIANRNLNKSHQVPHIGSPAVPLHLFHDFGQLIPARRIGRLEADRPWYWMNEAATQRLNEQTASDSRVRLTKFLFPHGCLCWRECPDCRKLSAYYGDKWCLEAPGLFPPPPLRAFDTEKCPDGISLDESEQRKDGAIDARACLHCGTLTYAQHTQTVMQSSFKSPPPSFIEEINRDLRATTMRANHIIFMGYSLPLDDVDYRAFFSASSQRGKTQDDHQHVRCTIVGRETSHPGWYGPSALKARIESFPQEHAVRAAIDIFGEKNVRFYGGGFPDVFLDGGTASGAKLEYLLNWPSTS